MTITIKNHGSDKGPSISGIASSVLFLVVFGVLWAAIGINGLQGFDEPRVAIGMLLIGLVLLIASLSLSWKTRRLPNRAAEKKEPDRQRKNKSFRIWPKYLSFIISFLVVGNFWIAHHRFSLVTHYDNRLLLVNLLVLMSIAFIPFPTSMISENGNRTATIFYALSIATTGLLCRHYCGGMLHEKID
ncbi:MAG: DUF1211 domain-containing protein [Ardenticatenaceae bacterium]|nr:DUF1211 domain-containing protein [Ardenticatenaceae bacterium]